MKQDESVKIWVDYWNSLKTSINDKSDKDQAELWNKRWSRPMDGMAKGGFAGEKEKRVKEMLKMLHETGFQVNGSRILDIGSGTGAIAIPFARAGATVTALDVSSAGLERLRSDAEKEGLSVETIERSWWTADIDELGLRNKFDLVFAVSTPALRDPDCLDRMMSCSNDLCYYGFFIQNGRHVREDYREVFEKILKKEPPGQAAGKRSLFINGFMYLYLAGYRPLIKVRHNQRDMMVDWNEAADETIRFLELSEACTPANRDAIREYYRSSAVDGKYHTRHDGYSGAMLWKVNSRGQLD